MQHAAAAVRSALLSPRACATAAPPRPPATAGKASTLAEYPPLSCGTARPPAPRSSYARACGAAQAPVAVSLTASCATRNHRCKLQRQGTSCAESAVPQTDARRNAVQVLKRVSEPQLLRLVLPAQLR